MKPITEFLIRNKLLMNLLAVFLMLAGVTALFQIPREAFPNIEFDIVTIRTNYAGSNAEQMERLITQPLEKELKEVEDIEEIWSVSSEGMSLVWMVIDPDADNKDRIINEIQRAVDRVEDLPTDLEERPVVRDMKTKNQPMMEVSLSGPFSQLELQEQAKRLEDLFLDIPGIATVRKDGYYEPQYHVQIDPRKLDLYHISLTQVSEALASQNVNVPGGTLVAPGGEIILRTTGEFFTPEEIESVVIRANDQGNALRVKDLAEVTLAHERPTLVYRTDGERAVVLLPVKKEQADVFDVKEAIEEKITRFKESAPPNLKTAFINDFSYYVKRRLNVLKWNGIIGLFLVMVPLLLFLNRSAAFGAIMGMPVAFFTTFAVMHFMGISINLLSMFGLIMVIGMLVDEDIVIAENIHRLLQEGKSYREAVIHGTAQVTKAVIATVLTTITAFIPLLMMSGTMGKFVQHIPQAVIITLIGSLIEALFILPVHIATLSHGKEKEDPNSFQERFFGKRMIDRIGGWIRYCVERRYRALGLFLVLIFLSGALWYWRLDFILFPRKGIEAFFIRAKLEKGTPLEVTEEKLKEVEKRLSILPPNELDHFVSEIGIVQNDPTDPFTSRGSHRAQIKVFLTPESRRSRDAEEIMDFLRPQFVDIQGFKELSFDPVRPGPPVGKPVAIRIKSDDFSNLEQAAEKIEAVLENLPGVSDIRNDFEEGKKEKRIVINHEKVAQSGLTLAEVARAVRFAFEGGVATTVKVGDEDRDVVVKFPEELRHDEASLSKVRISNQFGNLIPLLNVAVISEEVGFEAIRHHDRKRVITVSAIVDERITSSVKVNREAEKILKKTFSDKPDLHLHFGGEAEDTDESIHSFYRAFGLAILLTFIIIVGTLSDPVSPFVILSTILMGLIGVIIGFSITGDPLSFLALMGVVGMAGVVVDAAILIVDFVQKKEAEGLSPYEAILEGTKLRIRPIILTTLTTVLGIIPASIGLGGNDPFIQPMARALNWGIGLGALLAIFMIPAFLAIVQDVRQKFQTFRR